MGCICTDQLYFVNLHICLPRVPPRGLIIYGPPPAALSFSTSFNPDVWKFMEFMNICNVWSCMRFTEFWYIKVSGIYEIHGTYKIHDMRYMKYMFELLSTKNIYIWIACTYHLAAPTNEAHYRPVSALWRGTFLPFLSIDKRTMSEVCFHVYTSLLQVCFILFVYSSFE